MDVITKKYQKVEDLALSTNVITNVSVNLDLDDFQITGEYLPLSGGTVSGDVKIDGILSVNNKLLVGDNTIAESSQNVICGGQDSHCNGSNQIAFGQNCIAGTNGFKITDIVENKETSTYLITIDAKGDEIPDTIIGLDYSLTLMQAATNIGKIISIDHENSKLEINSNIPINKFVKGFYIYFASAPHIGNVVAAAGKWSTATGHSNKALGSCSHAEGYLAVAAGSYAHAEGKDTVASWGAHAEGCNTRALDVTAHSQGRLTLASGSQSFASGYGTAALDFMTNSHGYAAIAKDVRSFTWNGQYIDGYADDASGWASGDEKCRIRLDEQVDKVKNGEKSDLYTSHGKGTFNINPENGLRGFYIGEKNLAEILDINKYDYTAFEVFPTDKVISAGTVDNQNGVGDLLGIDNYKGTTDDKGNYLTYSVDVPAQMDCALDIRSSNVPNAKVIIDWGDDTLDEQYIYDENKTLNEEIKYRPIHTYTEPGKYTVKVYGDYYQMRSCANSKNSIVSRLFESDLPISSKLLNMSSFCSNGLPSLRLLRVNIPEYYNFKSLINYSGMFGSCENLLEFINNGSGTFLNTQIGTDNMFSNCINLHTVSNKFYSTNLCDSTFYMYANCTSLSSDILKILPECGFLGVNISLARMFENCEKLTCSDYDKLANILWKNPMNFSRVTGGMFVGCKSLDNSKIPVSYGGKLIDSDVTPNSYNITYVVNDSIGNNHKKQTYYKFKKLDITCSNEQYIIDMINTIDDGDYIVVFSPSTKIGFAKSVENIITIDDNTQKYIDNHNDNAGPEYGKPLLNLVFSIKNGQVNISKYVG